MNIKNSLVYPVILVKNVVNIAASPVRIPNGETETKRHKNILIFFPQQIRQEKCFYH